MPHDFPSKCPGCKQKFTKRRQWERHHCHLLRGQESPPGNSEDSAGDSADREEPEEAVAASA